MKTQIGPARVAMLALAPLLGCLTLALVGANRPERQIVGLWRVDGAQHSFEFKADGTFIEVRRETVREMRPLELSHLREAFWRTSGRYSFPTRDRLLLELGAPQADIAPTPTPIPQATSVASSEPIPSWAASQATPAQDTDSASAQPTATPTPAPIWARRSIAITLSGDTAQAAGAGGSHTWRQTWSRGGEMVAPPVVTAVTSPTPTSVLTAAPAPAASRAATAPFCQMPPGPWATEAQAPHAE